jgi:hypothetical protein
MQVKRMPTRQGASETASREAMQIRDWLDCAGGREGRRRARQLCCGAGEIRPVADHPRRERARVALVSRGDFVLRGAAAGTLGLTSRRRRQVRQLPVGKPFFPEQAYRHALERTTVRWLSLEVDQVMKPDRPRLHRRTRRAIRGRSFRPATRIRSAADPAAGSEHAGGIRAAQRAHQSVQASHVFFARRVVEMVVLAGVG